MSSYGPLARSGSRRAAPPRRAAVLAVLAIGTLLLSMGGLTVDRAVHPAGEVLTVTTGPAAVSPSPAIKCISCIELSPTWVNVTASGLDVQPPASFGGAAAWDPVSNETVYFGGNFEGGSSAASNATWVFADGAWTNITNPLDAPTARSYPAMDYDANMRGVLMFGGIGPDGTYLDDTWLFSDGAWTNVSSYSVAPPARAYAAMAFDPQPEENGSVLFGGYGPSGTGYFNDTWIWEGGAGWVKLTESSIAPPEVYAPSMAYDAANGYVVEFGGYLASGVQSSQTWELYSNEWWNVTTKTAPPAVDQAPMIYYPGGSGVLLFGGYNSTAESDSNETWLFDNGVWTKEAPSVAPPELDSSGFALADNGSVPILVDGFNLTKYGGYNETWAYVIAPSVVLEATTLDGEIGESIGYTATVSFEAAPLRASFSFGDGTDAYVVSEGSTITASHVFTTAGTYLAQVSVADAVDAVATSSLVEVHVSAGPSVRATASPAIADVGTSVAFVTNVTSPGTAPLKFAWTFGDGGTAATQNASHTYSKTGTFDATVVATDGDSATASAVVPVTIVADPSASAAIAPRQPLAGEMDRFYGNVSGGQGPYTYAWSFGDHSGSSLPDPLHQYNTSGTYSVQLWVNDSGGGSSHTSMTVTVGQTTLSGFVSGAPLWFWGGLGALAVAAVVGSVLLLRRPKVPAPSPATGGPTS